MAEAKTYRVIQNQPFCWQPKSARRFIRENFPRPRALMILAVYDALSEMASDAKSSEGLWDRDTIAGMACVSKSIASRSMADLREAGLIVETTRRGDKGFRLTSMISLTTHEENPKFKSELRESTHPQDVVSSPSDGHNSEKPKFKFLPKESEPQELEVLQNQEKTVLQKTAADAAPHQQIIDSHHVAFQGKYNIKPDYKPQDFAAVKSFLARGQTVNSFLRILPNFMAAPGKFTAGHSLKRACDNWQAYLESERGRVERPVGKVPAAAGAEHSLAGPFARH